MFRVKVDNTDPMVFYSSQGMECADGMVGIVNPNDDKTLDDYRERASQVSGAVTPKLPDTERYGGELADAGSSTDDLENDDNDNDDNDGNDDSDDGDDNDDSSEGDDEGTAGALRAPLMGAVFAMGVACIVG